MCNHIVKSYNYINNCEVKTILKLIKEQSVNDLNNYISNHKPDYFYEPYYLSTEKIIKWCQNVRKKKTRFISSFSYDLTDENPYFIILSCPIQYIYFKN